MNVAKIEYQGFMNGSASLTLPERGVLLVHGRNGAGKSSLLEAVAFALWGRTIRGEKPWRADSKARVRVADHTGFRVTRKPGACGLRFAQHGEKSIAYETTTKAQAALCALIGDFDVWRRAHVFSGEDAQHLSVATDGERKRLLESMLGLGGFDHALAACRAELATARAELRMAAGEQGKSKITLSAAETRCAELDQAPTTLPEARVADPLGAVAVLQSLDEQQARNHVRTYELHVATSAASKQARAEALRSKEADLRIRASAAASASGALERRSRLLASGVCPTCERDNARHLAEECEDQAKQLRAEEQELLDLAEAQRVEAQALHSEVVAAREIACVNARASAAALEQALRNKLVEQHRAQRLAALTNARHAVVVARDALDEAADAVLWRSREVAVLEVVERLLGLKGPRGAILSRSLDAITSAANAWLTRIDSRLSVRLRAYDERKHGISNAIKIEVEGAGGGHGYRACSAGERRKIDLAILFGLGAIDVGQHAARANSTMWMDEVADHLDSDSIPRVAEAIHELAADRCVVVITHREDLQRALRPAQRVHIAG